MMPAWATACMVRRSPREVSQFAGVSSTKMWCVLGTSEDSIVREVEHCWTNAQVLASSCQPPWH
jgi:hypothetical protein